MPSTQSNRSTTGDPKNYPLFSMLNAGLVTFRVNRLGVNEHDCATLDSGGVLVEILFPAPDNGLTHPMLIIAIRGGSSTRVAIAERLSTARFTLVWQTRRTEVFSCELYVPTQFLHREYMPDDDVFRLFARLTTTRYRDVERPDTSFISLEQFRAIKSVELLFGKNGEYGQFGPVSPHVNSGEHLRYLSFSLPTDVVPVPQ